MSRYTLTKAERLSSEKDIALLFAKGQRMTLSPFRIVWRQVASEPETPRLIMMVSAPKKKFPKAVERNRIRRLIREAFRLQKPDAILQLPEGASYHIAFLFADDQMPDLERIQKGMTMALDRWLKKISKPGK